MKKKEQNGLSSMQKQAEYIVGIGASAGGLEALQEFFKAVPLKTGIGYVVIQHLSPDYKSLMDELLARHTKLPIKKAVDGMLVEPDTIYLIPPRKNLSVFHGKLLLEDQGSRSGLILPIDIFFRSLANDLNKKAIGIILSGTGSDGTLGTRAIKEAGGMVMAQDEQTAKFDGMPRSSISTGLVDYILPPDRMPEELVNYIKHPFVDQSKQADMILTGDEDSFTKVMMMLRDYCGIDFSYYKENTIIRRLERRLSINRFEKLDDYLRFLSESDKEKDILYRELLIGVTRFFRDESAFKALADSILPKILTAEKKQVRIWSAACSTGEEVYSLAMLIRKYLDEQNLDIEVKIFATDIDRRSLELAGQGVYPESIVSDVEPAFLARYFVKRENGYQVGEALRKMAIFATHNVLKDPPFSKLDLILCRNLFIYLKPESQSKVLNLFYVALKPGGYMFMGSSETLGTLTEAFQTISSKHKIYSKKAGYQVSDMAKHAVTGFAVHKLSLDLPRQQGNKTAKFQGIADRILEMIMPPSILVDEQMNVIQFINDVNPFIQLKAGRFSLNLSALLPADIMALMNNMIRKLRLKGGKEVFENIKLKKGIDVLRINIEGCAVNYDSDQTFFLISFIMIDQANRQIAQTHQETNVEEQFQFRLTEIQNELQFTKENLQATVEELETSNEELQASNEELIASNEELQSTNEELQSVNEELYTVNSEYQNKIEELTQLNNDINNLLNNTEIGALYLDRKLCIRKYTNSFARLANILEFDTGRPIFHIAGAHLYPDFLADINYVQETLQKVEKELLRPDGHLYLVKIVPYRTDFQAVDGILITLVDITQLKRERDKLEKAGSRLQSALEMGGMAWWEWNIETGNVEMHEKKATMIGYTLEEFPRNVYEICKLIHPDDYEFTMQAMRDHLEGKKKVYDVTYRIRAKTGDYHYYHDKGGIVERDAQGKPLRLVGLVIDITHTKEIEFNLHKVQKSTRKNR